MTQSSTSLSQQVTILSIVLVATLVAGLGSFGWWAASRIDDKAIARQFGAIQRGLADLAARTSIEQGVSVVSDDAVINLRGDHQAWIVRNLGQWSSEFFGHDRVYIIGPGDGLVQALGHGLQLATADFQEHAEALAPLIARLRQKMSEASTGQADSTAAITGMGVMDTVSWGQGIPAIVSIRPVVPSTDAVRQRPGEEYLHISVRFIDQSVVDAIAEQYDIPGLAFVGATSSDSASMAVPVLSSGGRLLGFLAWDPQEPAFDLIRETAPVMSGALLMVGLALGLLVLRLRRTSTLLDDSKAKASFLAFHDPLTGIPNRALFEDRLEQAMANMRHTGSRMALHYIDLDRFKHVNDTLGHPAGDVLIREAARRLGGAVNEIDTVARLGGDEFAVIQFGVDDVPRALELSQRLIDCLSVPFEIEGQQARVGASIGVIVTADTGAMAEDLMRQADIALYEAKANGRGRYQLFAGELDEAVRDRRELEIDLRAALASDHGLELVYQPIYQARSRTMAGAEALVRWQHPTRGHLAPPSFIGLAEERGLIDQLGYWVMRKACHFAATSDLPWVAVNVSPIQFRDEWFADRVFEILDETGLPPKRLEIEITEGLLLQNSPAIQATLTRLRASGIRVALDDFGTGYSSISYLRSHGVDKLKIDQSFTAQLGADPEIDSIVRSIIDLGRAMRMTVTAEGVETSEQRLILDAMGCSQLQGYLLSQPLKPQRLREMLDPARFDDLAAPDRLGVTG